MELVLVLAAVRRDDAVRVTLQTCIMADFPSLHLSLRAKFNHKLRPETYL